MYSKYELSQVPIPLKKRTNPSFLLVSLFVVSFYKVLDERLAPVSAETSREFLAARAEVGGNRVPDEAPPFEGRLVTQHFSEQGYLVLGREAVSLPSDPRRGRLRSRNRRGGRSSWTCRRRHDNTGNNKLLQKSENENYPLHG